MADRLVSPQALAEAIGPGERVFLPGSAGEPTALLDAWAARPELSRGLRITTSAVPGVNPLDLDVLDPSAVVSGPFMQPSFRDAQRAGRFRHLPLSYWGMVRELRERAAFDTCVVQVAPPDAMPRLGPGVASLPRHAVDVVVTEHGAADLRGLGVHGRAEALIAVAAPAFRGELAEAWRAMARAL